MSTGTRQSDQRLPTPFPSPPQHSRNAAARSWWGFAMLHVGGTGGWRSWLPTALLLFVAITQILLTKTADLSPWKGGGFGMFATTDGTAFRYVRLFVDAPERSEELSVPESLEDAALRAQLFPSDHFLLRLGEAAALRERRQGRLVSSVRVEVWKIEFSNPPLRSTERKLRSFTVHIEPTRVSGE